MKEKIKPEYFYNLFVKEIKRNKIEKFWDNNKKWTAKLLRGDECIMKKIASKFGLFFCHEYYTLDGVFYDKLEIKNPFNRKSIERYGWARNIKIILEVENDPRTLFKEIYKLIPIFVAPLVVLVTYFDTRGAEKDKNETEKIINVIKNRISSDDLGLYKKMIKTLLIIGFKDNKKINWRGFVYNNDKFKTIS